MLHASLFGWAETLLLLLQQRSYGKFISLHMIRDDICNSPQENPILCLSASMDHCLFQCLYLCSPWRFHCLHVASAKGSRSLTKSALHVVLGMPTHTCGILQNVRVYCHSPPTLWLCCVFWAASVAICAKVLITTHTSWTVLHRQTYFPAVRQYDIFPQRKKSLVQRQAISYPPSI